MTPENKRKLKDAFKQWSENNSQPDAPMNGFLGGGLLSPRQAALEMENETATGKGLMEILEYGVEIEDIDKVISRLVNHGL